MILYNSERASRFGVLRKDASSEAGIRWFELPAMYAYHVANAWQEGDTIRIFLCVYEEGVSHMYTPCQEGVSLQLHNLAHHAAAAKGWCLAILFGCVC